MRLKMLFISSVVHRVFKQICLILGVVLLAACANNQRIYEEANVAFRDDNYASARQGYEHYLQGKVDNISDDRTKLVLGRMYLLGLGGDQDFNKAVRYLEQVHISINMYEAKHLLADIYLNGYGVKKDVVRAIELYKMAGSKRASLDLAMLYLDGVEVPKSVDKTLRIVNDTVKSLGRENDDLFDLFYHFGYLEYCQESFDAVIAVNRGGCLNKDDKSLIESSQALWQQRDKKSENFAAEFVIRLYLATVNKKHDELLAWFHWAATQGQALGQRVLGVAYLQGNGVEQDHRKAMYWIEKAAAQGEPSATFIMGRLALSPLAEKGEAAVPDYHSAKDFFKLAARKGHSDAILMLANMYLNPPKGLDRNIQKGFKWLEVGVKNGDKRAKHKLADAYFNDDFGMSDKHPAAMEMYQELYYHEDDIKAAYHLGIHHALGSKTIRKDEMSAHDWLTEAAEKDYLPAKLALANYLIVIDRPERAAEWREKIVYLDLTKVSASDAKAIVQQQYKQAMYYYNKKNPKHDISKTVRLLTMASKAKSHKAQAFLGLMYYEGKDIPKDLDKAYKWLSSWDLQKTRAINKLPPDASGWNTVTVGMAYSNEKASSALLNLTLQRYKP